MAAMDRYEEQAEARLARELGLEGEGEGGEKPGEVVQEKKEEPKKKKEGAEGEDDDSDLEFDELDPSLINNDLDPITPQPARAASRTGWVC